MSGPIRSQAAPNPTLLKASGSTASQPTPEPAKQDAPRNPGMQADALSLSGGAKPAGACAHDGGGCLCAALDAAKNAPTGGEILTKTTVIELEARKPIPPALHAQAVKEALSSGNPTSFTNSLGQTETIRIARDGSRGNKDTYDIKVGADSFELRIPQGEDPTVNLALAVNLFSMNLPKIRDELDTLVITPEANPQDEHWAKTYNMPNFSSAATAGGGVITYWHNGRNLDKATFDHEMGHIMGPKASSKHQMMPDGYEDVIAKDGKTPTAYSKAAPIEDFAESWSLYLKARQTSPEALAKFRADYPNRAAVMEQFWNRFAPPEGQGANPATLNPKPSVDLRSLEMKREYVKKGTNEVVRTRTESFAPPEPAKPPEVKLLPNQGTQTKPPETKQPAQQAKAPEPKPAAQQAKPPAGKQPSKPADAKHAPQKPAEKATQPASKTKAPDAKQSPHQAAAKATLPAHKAKASNGKADTQKAQDPEAKQPEKQPAKPAAGPAAGLDTLSMESLF